MSRFKLLTTTLVMLFICAISLNAQQNKNVRTDLSVSQFKEYLAINPSVTLLDVRTLEEFTAGHLQNAINIPVNDPTFDQKVSTFDKGKAILVYCRSGHRSVVASNKLQSLGFVYILNLEKGINSWLAAGETVVK